MSDQTPPSSEPTPHPHEGAAGGPEPTSETVAGSAPESSPQSVPVSDEATTTAPVPPPAYDEAAPAAPAKSRKGLMVGVIAALLVVVLVAGGAALVLTKSSNKHTLSTPATAGSMKRDSTKEKALATQLTQAEQQFKTQATGVSYVKSAVYNQADAKRGPAGGLVFLGAKLSKPIEKNPTTFVASFTKQAKANGLTVTDTAAGSNGGKAVCASVATPQKVAICAWATQDTVGELVPTVPGYDSTALAKIMRALRADVEKSD